LTGNMLPIRVCLFIFLLCKLTASLTIKEFEIFDLHENSTDFFQEAAQWQTTGTLTSTKTTICAGSYLLAGFQILQSSATMQRTYTIDKPHKSVFISFEAWMFNSWTTTDKVMILIKNSDQTFSSQPLIKQTRTLNYSLSGTCNSNPSSYYSKKSTLISSPHQGSTLTIFLESTTKTSATTLGIRNLKISISNTTVSTATQCFESESSYVTNSCDCPVGKRPSGSSCVNCDNSCETCYGATAEKCYSCNTGFSYDGTECRSCFSGCSKCSGPGEYECQDCQSGYHLYPTSNCQSTCAAPYTSGIVNGVRRCYQSCSQTGEFYYSNTSCISTCKPPFTESTDSNGAKFCNYPCKSNEYLYPSGLCFPTACPGNFQVQNYGSPEYQYCVCPLSYTLTSDGDCIFVVPPLPEVSNTTATEEAMEKVASAANTAGAINSVGLALAAIVIPGDPGGVSSGTLTKILQYSKFFNIGYPEKLVVMFKSYNPASGIMSFVPKMNDGMKRKFKDEEIPVNFRVYRVHSSFIVNFWSSMLFLIILLTICGGLRLLEIMVPEFGYWVRKIRVILQNFWIVQFYNSSGDIFLFSVIQFRYNHWDSAESVLSFILAIVFFCGVFVVIFIHIRTVIKYQRVKKERAETLKKFEQNYEGNQIFFDSFVNQTIWQQLFLLYFVLRILVLNLIIVSLLGYPIIQSLLMIALSLGLIVYLIIRRPFKSRIDLAQNLSFELALLIVNVSLLVLSSLDGNNEIKMDTRNRLADLIVACSLIFNFLPMGFLALKAVVLGIQFYNEYNQKKNGGGNNKVIGGSFEQRVEELRVTRRIERQHNPQNLLNPIQGLNIKQSRETLSNRTAAKGSTDITLDIQNSSTLMMENNDQSIRPHYIKRTQLSPEQNLDLSSMSIQPLNSSSIYHPDESGMDFTLPETQYQENVERYREFIPNRNNSNVEVRRVGRARHHVNAQYNGGLEKHPFREEIRKYSNDGASGGTIMENIKARHQRVVERIKKRNQVRKFSDFHDK